MNAARFTTVCLLALAPAMAHAADAGSAPAASPSAADKAMMAGMMHMRQQMSDAPMTGNADGDFVSMMIPHHAGAVDMARVELRYGTDPEMRRLASEVVAAQEREIAMMRAWQKAHPQG